MAERGTSPMYRRDALDYGRSMPPIALGPLTDFPERYGVPVQVGERALAVFRCGERVYSRFFQNG